MVNLDICLGDHGLLLAHGRLVINFLLLVVLIVLEALPEQLVHFLGEPSLHLELSIKL